MFCLFMVSPTMKWNRAFQLVSCFLLTFHWYILEVVELDVCFVGLNSLMDIAKILLQCWNVGQYCINWNCFEQRLSKIIVIPTLMSQTPGKLYISKTELSTESSSSEIGGVKIEHLFPSSEQSVVCQNILLKLAVLCNVFLYLCWGPKAECLRRFRL